MDGRYFRIQRKVSHSTYNGDPWQFSRGLDTLDNSRGYMIAARNIWPRREYRIVEHITGELYDVVPEEPTTNG